MSLRAQGLLVLFVAACGPAAPEPVVGPPPATAKSALPISSAQPVLASNGAKPPPTAKRPTSDTYQGTTIVDDYRWLEDGKSSEVQDWTAAQTAFTRSILDKLTQREAIRTRVSGLLSTSSADRFGLRQIHGSLFALKDQPPKQQAFLVTMKSADDPASERVLVDPNVIDSTGKTTIDFYVPSADGKRVAVSLSRGGSESGTIHVYDVDTGKETGDVIERVNGGTAGGSVTWSGDGKRLYYTRYPHEGERPAADLDFYQQVWVHTLGKPVSTDTYSIGKDFPRIAEVELATSDDGRFVLARVANGDGGEFAHYLLGPGDKWTQIAKHADKIVGAQFGRDNQLYLRSIADAPHGKILKLDPKTPDLAKAKVVVPEGQPVIKSFVATKTRIYVVDLIGGPSQIRVFSSNGKALPQVPILPISAVGEITPLEGDDILFRNESYVDAPAWYRYVAKGEKTKKTALFLTSSADLSDAVVTREMCKSRDGTLIPLNIVKKKSAVLDGKNPVLLTGYGGYSVSRSPRFNPIYRLWLDQGGIYASANLRGGGEFGEEWHRAGNLTKKQNVFDDFFACAQYLVDSHATSPDRLAIMGGSNGGLLMGAEIVQHPEMWKAVVSSVGIYDMLRVETTPNGAFNVTEFGSVKDPEQLKALLAYSPFHNVKDGAKYPATLMLTGANDPRVDPYNSRKMVARLQAATSSNAPILLRASGDTGHGGGTPLSAEIAETSDVYSFLFDQLGVAFH